MSDGPARPGSTLLGRYRLERELGAGGMARVYEAEDVRYGRRVAIKVFRPELAATFGTARFLREIETSARLRHPHILPLLDSGEIEDTLFYVMPLVEGESLRARLDRERQLPIEEALLCAREVADALAHAHGRGVIHRDIKPENILLDNGHAVVVDFGIARVVRDADSRDLTGTGLALGTPRYMSPEQAAGEKEIDGRTDVYSLACTLFEMLAGRPPFIGRSTGRVFVQQMAETPPSVFEFRADVPAGVAAALQRALAKAPADRFATAAEFARALVMPVRQAAGAEPSVAVLPFLNLSADPENEYFADGITEDVIAQLSKIRALKVVSRTSVMPFKKREQGLREIATRLQVATLLDGSVRRAGSRVRIVSRLVEAATDRYLWAETYDRELTDIFAIQSEVALHIATALRTELSTDERERIGRAPTSDPHAYQFYLQGRHHFIRFTTDNLKRAIEYFERAIERDPDYAMAWTGLAKAFTELAEGGGLHPDDAYPRARSAVARALALDPELSDAHCTAAYVRMTYDFEWTDAEDGFKRALTLSPGSADAWDYYGRLCSAVGRYDEAIEMCRRAQELDPLAHRVDLATAYLRAGRFEEALAAVTQAVALDRDDPRAHATLGWSQLGLGRVDDGIASLERAVELSPDNTLWQCQLGQACARVGRTDRAEAILRRLTGQSRARYVSPYHLAYVHTGLGQYEEAMDCLEQALDMRAGAMYGVKGSFLFGPLRSHPRFQMLLRRLNLAG